MAKDTYNLFMGNPLVGKSTLMNCVIGEAAFKTGVTTETEVNKTLEEKKTEKGVFLDTLGLGDVERREEAAEAITEALKKTGHYKIFFVVTVDSGRIRPEDVISMNLILESCSDITHYSIIFNKLPKPFFQKFSDKNDMVNQILEKVASTNKMKYLLLPIIDNLDDVDNIPELDSFIDSTVELEIQAQNVRSINIKQWDEQVHALGEVLKQLKDEKAADLSKFRELKASHDQAMSIMQIAAEDVQGRALSTPLHPCAIS